jgi:hypothetical protein
MPTMLEQRAAEAGTNINSLFGNINNTLIQLKYLVN